MKIHSVFHATSRRSAWLADLLNQPNVYDGGFARVVPLTPYSVLKVTCCPATRLFFDEQLKATKKGGAVSTHLPAVLKSFGPAVRDAEGILFFGYEVERLFEAADVDARAIARVTGKQLLQKIKPGYSSQLARESENFFEDLQEALREEQAIRSAPTWENSEKIAISLSLRTKGELSSAFLSLAKFVRRHKMHLDLLGSGNILLNVFGEPCLGDPVCDDSADLEPHQPEQESFCLGVFTPRKLEGLRATLSPRGTLPLTAPELEATCEKLRDLGLAPQVFRWGTAELSDFLALPPKTVSVWDIPSVAKQLKAGNYEKVFTE